MRRSEIATLLLSATMATTLAMTLLSGPGSAAPENPGSGPGSVILPPQADDAASSALKRAEAALTGAGTPSPGTVESPTLALLDLRRAYPDLTRAEQRRADQLLARPTADEFSDPVLEWGTDESPASPSCAEHICVHWTTETHVPPPGWVETTLAEMEAVWDFEVETLGYRAPAADGTRGDGDGTTGLFDVYLSDLGPKGYYGYCIAENPISGQPQRKFGFCVLDNDYVGYPKPGLPSLQVTAAHEFFHAIQFNYDVDEDNWIKEATATWIEERYADQVNDSRGYLKYGQLGKPAKPLDTFGGLTHYGNWLFFERFSAKYGVSAVRSIWNRLDATVGKPDQYSMQALKGFLKARGSSFPSFYAAFAASNLIPGRTYSEGSAYRASPFADTFKLKAGRTAIRPQTRKLRHLASASYRFKAAKSLRSARRLRIVIDGPKRATAPVVVAYTYFKSGKITKKTIKLSKSGAGSAKVKFNRKKVKKVTLTLVNASTRYSCGDGVYSCQGAAKDDPVKFVFRVRALR